MTTAKFKFMDASSFVLEGQLLYDNFRYEVSTPSYIINLL